MVLHSIRDSRGDEGGKNDTRGAHSISSPYVHQSCLHTNARIWWIDWIISVIRATIYNDHIGLVTLGILESGLHLGNDKSRGSLMILKPTLAFVVIIMIMEGTHPINHV